MKKKYIITAFLAVGIVLLGVSVGLAVISVSSMDIIGGTDFPSFVFALFRENGGACLVLALLGIAAIVASSVLGIAKNSDKEKIIKSNK